MAHILLVDDNPSVRALFQVILEDQGHSVSNASNGIDGLELFRKRTFDLVITDLLMPEMNGKEFIFEVKKKSPELPVIAVSGDEPDPEDQVLSLILTGDTVKHLKKPFKPAVLVSMISQLL